MLERQNSREPGTPNTAAARQAEVAFYLTGRCPGNELEPVAERGLRPALLARYRDLSSLRYDYPVVLVGNSDPEHCVRPLSGLIDQALAAVAHGADDRISQHVLRLERQLRVAAADGGSRPLSELWAETAATMGAGEDAELKDSLDKAWGAMPADGEVADCDDRLPERLAAHVWLAVQEDKARRLRREIARLVHRVSEILRADLARSEQGRSAEMLEASVGGLDAEAFDFGALSRVLVRTANRTTLTGDRRGRLERIIAALEAYDFDPAALRFDSCRTALEAWRDRFPVLTGVARAIAMAELEIAGDYREERHDVFFEDYGADGLSPDDLALFADGLVCVNAATMDAAEQAALMEILSAGLPMKVLVQTDDVLGETRPGTAPRGFGRSAPHFAHMALGLNDVYALQAAASHLPACKDRVADGMTYPGAALFSVFSGATESAADLPPYLVAAAAVDARAFPVFAFDPSAGDTWASRFSLDGNPQPDGDWPEHELAYEDRDRRRVTERLAFTYVDFAALDARYARHLARVPEARWDTEMVSVAEALARPPGSDPEPVPGIFMVDREDRLQKVLVDERLLREARRCREAWHALQEQGGIHNSHAERLLAEARASGTITVAEAGGIAGQDGADGRAVIVAGEPVSAAGEGAEPTAEIDVADTPDPGAELSEDDPYIETPRCTTCNECTQINDKMFAYNENRQAYIADPDAGTYAQLVEAAESCQVSIIHPGKPRNPDEPGLDALIERAEAFL